MSLHVFGMLTGRHNDKVISVDGARAVSLSLVEDAWQCLSWAAACRIHISPSQQLDTPCQAIPTHSDFFRLILLWQLNICGWLCWCVKKKGPCASTGIMTEQLSCSGFTIMSLRCCSRAANVAISMVSASNGGIAA